MTREGSVIKEAVAPSSETYIPVFKGARLCAQNVSRLVEKIRLLKNAGELGEDECLTVIVQDIESAEERKLIFKQIKDCHNACRNNIRIAHLNMGFNDCAEMCMFEASQNFQHQENKTFRDFLQKIRETKTARKWLIKKHSSNP